MSSRHRMRRLGSGVGVLLLCLPAVALAGQTTTPTRSADLSLTLTGNAGVVQAGEVATFEAVIRNDGPQGARRVRAQVTLSAPATVATAAGEGWTCTVSGSDADCTRRRIRRNRDTTITITATPAAGTPRINARGGVSASRSTDPNPANNATQASVSVNTPPTAGGDTATTTTDTPVAIDVTANDVDPDADSLEATLQTAPTTGTAVCQFTTCRYTPAPGATGTDAFTYVVADGRGGRATGTVTVTLTPPSPPPTPSAPTPPTPAPPSPPVENGPNSDPEALVAGPSAVTAGGTHRYVITVTNSCAVVARDVVVQVALPEGTRLVGAPVGATRTNRTLTVRLGTVARGRTHRLALRLRFTAAGGTVRTLVTSVTSSNAAVTGDGIVIAVNPRR